MKPRPVEFFLNCLDALDSEGKLSHVTDLFNCKVTLSPCPFFSGIFFSRAMMVRDPAISHLLHPHTISELRDLYVFTRKANEIR